jgi:integrase
MTLDSFFADYYKPLKLRGRSENTVRLYRNTLKQYAEFLGRPATLEDDLNDLQVARYLEKRSSERSPFTAEKERNQLCALWRCAADRRMIEMRPCVPPTQIPARIPTAWTIESLRKILAVAKVLPTRGKLGMVGDVPERIFWPALILVLWQCAERIGAIMAVKKEDYVRPRIIVQAEYRKGGKRDKLYTFTDQTCDLLDILMQSKNGPHLFEWPKCYSYLWGRFGEIVKKAGIEGGRRSKFHMLRRSAATHFLRMGGDPVALLDHSSPKITKAYIDPRLIDTGPQPCDVLPDIN